MDRGYISNESILPKYTVSIVAEKLPKKEIYYYTLSDNIEDQIHACNIVVMGLAAMVEDMRQYMIEGSTPETLEITKEVYNAYVKGLMDRFIDDLIYIEKDVE